MGAGRGSKLKAARPAADERGADKARTPVRTQAQARRCGGRESLIHYPPRWPMSAGFADGRRLRPADFRPALSRMENVA